MVPWPYLVERVFMLLQPRLDKEEGERSCGAEVEEDGDEEVHQDDPEGCVSPSAEDSGEEVCHREDGLLDNRDDKEEHEGEDY